MPEDLPASTKLTAAARARAVRDARQAEALRANLRRRKEQTRERQAEPRPDPEAEPAHSLYPDISDKL